MGEVIWVEILSRHRDVLMRYRCLGPEIRIGRGYDNDVIVDDPYVAPRHLRIVRNPEGVLVAEDLGSANGLFADQGTVRLESAALDGDGPIRIGRTYLRIRDANHTVKEERIAKPGVRQWPTALALGGTIVIVEILSLWLGETERPKVYRYALPLLLAAVGVLGWTALWAILSRIFAGRARFARHLLIALAGLLAYSLLNEMVDYGTFALSWRALVDYEYVAAWFLLATICFVHVRGVGEPRLKLKGGAVTALAVIAIAMHTLVRHEMRFSDDQQSYLRHLKPPALRLTPPQSESAFFAEIERLKSRLQRARMEEPPVSAAYADLDE